MEKSGSANFDIESAMCPRLPIKAGLVHKISEPLPKTKQVAEKLLPSITMTTYPLAAQIQHYQSLL